MLIVGIKLRKEEHATIPGSKLYFCKGNSGWEEEV